MKKNSLKTLSIALALGTTLTLASCDKISNLFSSSSETKVATASADNKTSTDSTKVVVKADNKTQTTNNKVTTSVTKTNADLSTAAIAKSLANAKDLDPKKVLTNLDAGYTPFLAQVGGLKLDSQDVKELNTFVENYSKTENSNNANNSLYNNFANDLGTEVIVFNQDKPEYDYPALPKATGDSTKDEKLYQDYKQNLVNNFLKQVDGRLKVYKDPSFQKKFFNAEQKDIPGLLTEADQLVANYKSVTKKLTSGSLACDKLSGLNTKAKCFRDYLGLIANYPTTLNAIAENNPDAVTPDFLDNTANPIVRFENAYLTSPEKASEESQINQTVKVAKTAVANLASDIKDKANAAVDSIKETASKVVDAVTNSDATEKAKEVASDSKDKAKEIATKVVDETKEVANKVAEKTKEVANNTKEKVKATAEKVVDKAEEKTKETASSIASAVKEKVSSVVEATKEKASDLVDKAKSLVSSDKKEVAATSTTTAAAASAINSAYNLPGYTYSLDKATSLLANINDDSDVKAIKTLNDVYPDVISQIAGFTYNSSENLVVVKFGKNYQEDQAKNSSLFSLYNNFANDLNNEVLDFTSDSSANYPSLPTKAADLDKYRDQLVDDFTKAITDRLATYKTTAYQKRYFEYNNEAELETLLNYADKLVGSYIALLQTSTLDTPKACTVGSVETQAKCFRSYIKILAEYPNVLLNSYFAEKQPDNAVASPDFLDNTANTIVNFVKTYNK